MESWEVYSKKGPIGDFSVSAELHDDNVQVCIHFVPSAEYIEQFEKTYCGEFTHVYYEGRLSEEDDQTPTTLLKVMDSMVLAQLSTKLTGKGRRFPKAILEDSTPLTDNSKVLVFVPPEDRYKELDGVNYEELKTMVDGLYPDPTRILRDTEDFVDR